MGKMLRVSSLYRRSYEACRACLEIQRMLRVLLRTRSLRSIFIPDIVEPGHDIFPDSFRKPHQSFFFLLVLICFLSGVVVVLKLMRIIISLNASPLNPSECHLQDLGFWRSHFLAVTLRELPSRFVVREAQGFLWCIVEWNVTTAELGVDVFFPEFFTKATRGYPSFRNVEQGRHRWHFAMAVLWQERWGSPVKRRRRLTQELLAPLKHVKFCCRVLEFGVSLLNPNRDCCWPMPFTGAGFYPPWGKAGIYSA